MMQWKKDPNMRYVDMCIYIDEHVPELLNPDCPTNITDTIYNYLWLLVKALAIKKRMFNSFQDYDGYAFYAANRLFFALKKNLENQEKIIKGKLIKPIKSCLNYTKALLYPMKIEFLRAEYATAAAAAETSKNFDEFTFKQRIRNEAWYQQGGVDDFKNLIYDLFKNFNAMLDDVLAKTPFNKNTAEYKKIRISILLNCLQNLKNKKGINADPVTVIVWKLPKSMGNYIRVFMKELGTQLKREIMSCYQDVQIDEKVLDFMISNPDGEFINHEED